MSSKEKQDINEVKKTSKQKQTEKCIHGSRARDCVKCKPELLCPHSKRKQHCKECSSDKFCEHNRKRETCRECNKEGVECEHGIRKYNCRECNPQSVLCPHQKLKNDCPECRPNLKCEHGKYKRFCSKCNPEIICEHGIQRRRCKECEPSIVCIHNVRKNDCTRCYVSLLCCHSTRKKDCLVCNKKKLCCIHNLRKKYCKECDGSLLCKFETCETVANKKYDGYCAYCFIKLFPDNIIVKNYKTKERAVVDFVKKHFPDNKWRWNKQIEDGKYKKRPDLFLSLEHQNIIIEVDENMHQTYDYVCEEKRIGEIADDLNYRSIVFIRFNPDGYFDIDGKKIKSCWTIQKITGISYVNQRDETNWKNRLNRLKETLEYWMNIENKTDKPIEIIQLFYDQNSELVNEDSE